MQKRSVGLFIFQLSGLFSTISNAGQELNYNKVGELYLQSFESIAPEEKPSNEPIDFKSETQLSDREMRSITFSAFASTPDNQQNKKTYSDLETAAKDLNLFSYQSKEQGSEKNSLFSKINNTVTVLGEAVLAKQLANPIANIDQLNKKQAFITLLLNNEELFQKLNDTIKSIVDDQSGLLYFWKEVEATEQKSLSSLFLPKDGFFQGSNKSSIVQEVYTHKSGFLLSVPILISIVKAMQSELKRRDYAFHAKRIESLGGGWGQGASLRQERCCENDAKTNRNLYLGFAGIFALVTSYLGYSLIPPIELRNKLSYIHKKLICVSGLLRAFDTIQDLLKGHHIPMDLVFGDTPTKESEDSPDLDTLLSLLRTNTFRGNPSFFSWTGRVKAAYYLMQKHKTEFVTFMKFVGAIDAYLSIVKLYKKNHNGDNHYSFVKFVDKKVPYISAYQFWNPMLDAGVAVANNVACNLNGKGRIAIVTGPNLAGKSTIMIHGITDTLWLAQTLGIAPAIHLAVTPFALIATSIKVQEDIVSGQSHFVAQAQHATKLLESIKNLPTDKKAFMAIDGLFEGTTAAVGSKALHDFGKSLAQYKNLIAVICTQYQSDPTLLEQETKGICKNYKVDVVKNADGTITHPYLVEEGVGQVKVGAQLLSEAYTQSDQDQEIDTSEDKESPESNNQFDNSIYNVNSG